MCVQECYVFWMANIALRVVNCFTDIHFTLGSLMTYSLKILDRKNMRKSCQELGYIFVS